MKLLRRILLAGASLVAMTAHASADPIFTPIAAWLFAGPLGAVLSINAIYAGVQALFGIGLSIASSALQGGGAQQSANPGQFKNTFEAASMSEIRGVGRGRVGGLKVFGNTIDVYRYRLLGHSRGRVDAVEEHYLGGRPVTVEDETGEVSSPPWTRPGGSWVTISSKAGDGAETAWPVLMSDFPDLWTSDHRLRGVAQSLVIYQSPGISSPLFLKLYQSGEPAYERLQRNEVLYDPRQDSTRGGFGLQRAGDPATWGWSDNGILCAVHIMRSYPDLGDEDFDWSYIAAEADRADALVATLTGTEPRSRCWGFWESQRPRGEVMLDVLRSVGAEVQLSDEGKVRIRLVDDDRTGDITFTEDHIVDFDWGSGPEAVERPNRCSVWYYSPERNYDMAEIPDMPSIAWANVEPEIDRYGEKVEEIRLPFCPSASQAQRIARRLFAMKRADAGTIVTNMAGLAACDRSVVNIALPDLDETVACEIASPRESAEGKVEIPYIVLPLLEPWNPAVHEAPPPPAIPTMDYEAEIDTPEPPTGALLVRYPDATYEVRATYALPAGASEAEATFRLYTGGLPSSWHSMVEFSNPVYAYGAGGGPGQTIDVRMRVFDVDGNGSYFSDVFSTALAIDDTAPASAPNADVTITADATSPPTSALFDNVAPNALNIAYARLTRSYRPSGGSYGPPAIAVEENVRPGQSYGLLDAGLVPINVGDSWKWSLTFHTSDDTSSPAFEYEYTRGS